MVKKKLNERYHVIALMNFGSHFTKEFFLKSAREFLFILNLTIMNQIVEAIICPSAISSIMLKRIKSYVEIMVILFLGFT